ncbi:hypothetical protein BZARG_8 [Bizionia argentinensis JUB59]|uniref:Cupin domain-containing protein n=1 Tax=Bizionia argentinensis JUB59 TaxID=1046627 RepID=G2E900_9FLAO|nr:hypothetical protein [Bizionia argentinensis]EGV45022.1 hypothetical protein BZARG_8 [Bizionia argentinensis JUB59]
MKKSSLNIIVLSIIMLVISSCVNEKKREAEISDIGKEQVEGMSEVLFENDFAEVSKIILAPNEFLTEHDGGERVVYSLSDYSLDWEEKGKSLGTKSRKKGEVHFHKAGDHSAKNNGTTNAEWIVFTRKGWDLPDCGENKVEHDVNDVSPDSSKHLWDNESFKVTKVILPKGQKLPMHSGVNRIVYSLSDYQIMYNSDGGSESDGVKKMKIGDIHWHNACQHSIENTGDSDAEYIVVSYKKKE